MDRLTLSRFRAQWPQESMGICQSDPMVRDYCNDAVDRLMIDPLTPEEGWAFGWVSMVVSASITNSYAYVTVPREIVRLIVTAVCQQGIRIRNQFWEYLTFNTGLRPKTCLNSLCGDYLQAYERDNVVTLTDLVGTKTVRIYPNDVRDVGKRVLIQGKDANGQIVLTTDPGTGKSAQGEYVVLQMPFVDSVNQYSSITGLQKDESYGPLTFYQVDPTTLVESPLSSMEPNEGVAWYRRYLVSGIPTQNLCCNTTTATTLQLEANGRIGFVPVENETDYVSINNAPAIIEECRSLRFSRMDSPAAAQQSLVHHGRAIALLNGQLDQIYGKTNAAVRVPIFGSQRLTRQPV